MMNQPQLVTAWNSGASMNEKTALCFLTTGLALLELTGKMHVALLRVLAVFILILVAFSLEFISLTRYWDEHVARWLLGAQHLESRMSIYTAIAFVITAAFILRFSKREEAEATQIAVLFGPVVLAIPSAALLCRFLNVVPYGSAGLGAMAFHTIIGLMITGIAISIIETTHLREQVARLWPLATFAFVFTMTLVIWQAVIAVGTEERPFLPALVLYGGTAIASIVTVLGYLTQSSYYHLSLARDRERKLEELNAHLEDRVHARTLELNQRNDELEKFAGIAAHDLKSPIGTMVSYADLASDNLTFRLDREELRHDLEKIRASGMRALNLIDQLLEVAKSGRRLRSTIVDLNLVFESAMGNLQSEILKTNAKIQSARLPRVCGDETQLLQLFQNLLGNAIKFTRPNQAPEVYINVEDDGTDWRLSVADKGIGMTASQSEIVFELFGRAHSEYQGTGIGLAVCRKIVESHGGKIWLRSEVGVGTTFYFRLPKLESRRLM